MNTLQSLFKDMPCVAFGGDWKTPVASLVTDSRRVVPGSLFFAIGGLRTDGHLYIEEAIDRGAMAIVSEKPFRPAGNISHVQVVSARAALAAVARRFYGCPDEVIDVTGVTGTNGKTTVAFLAQYLLESKPCEVGLLGTVRYDLGQRTLPAYKTTPESVDIYAMLAQMRDNQCRRCVMEVSSHAIDQLRVQGLRVDVAAFLNLTQDHIDYHKTMEDYFLVKSRLFTGQTGNVPRCAVVNVDDPWGQRLTGMIPEQTQLWRFGMHHDAEFRADSLELYPDKTLFRLVWPGGEQTVRSPLLGRYNVSNVLAAVAMLHASGGDVAQALGRLSSFAGVPGRMERVDVGQKFQVLVDYAHTDDALHNALSMLRDVTRGRLLVVFGCGGNRDRDKRPKMTAAVQRWADYAWATSDNPRKESVATIFEDMQAGVSRPEAIRFVEERRRAIALAIEAAAPGDCLLIAGKGHETSQEFADTIVPFDDRQTARELLALRYSPHS